MDVFIVHTSVESDVEAQKLIKAALQNHLAACVQCAPVTSTYWWDGKITSATEISMGFKTAHDRVDALMVYLRRHHSYDTPQLLAQKCDASDELYAAWVHKVTRPLANES